MRLLVISVALCFAQLSAAEQAWNEATQRFVGELFESPDFVERWRPVVWELGNSGRPDPNGGYLFRFELKFGEESTFLFLGTDRFAGPSWSVYRSDQQGGVERISDPLGMQLDPRGVHLDLENRRILWHHPTDLGPLASRDPAWSFTVLTFDDNGTIDKEYFAAKDLDDEGSEKLRESGRLFSPEIEKIPLTAYLQAPSTAWSRLDSDHSFASQSLDPADVDLLEEHGNLTFDDAKELGRKNLDIRASNDRPVGSYRSFDQLPEARRGVGGGEDRSNEVDKKAETPTRLLILGAIAVLGVVVILVRAFVRDRAP